MIFARRTPHTPATLVSPTDGLDMKVSTRQKQGATRHKGAGAKGDNSASWVSGSPRDPAQPRLWPPHRSPNRTFTRHRERSLAFFLSRPVTAGRARHAERDLFFCSIAVIVAQPLLPTGLAFEFVNRLRDKGTGSRCTCSRISVGRGFI